MEADDSQIILPAFFSWRKTNRN